MLVTMRREDEDDDDDQQTRVFYELSAMIVHLLRPPPLPSPFPQPFGSSSSVPPPPPSLSSRPSHFSSPTAFASLFLGISLALMLLGSVTFLIGFILMPWVVGLVILFYFAGIVRSLSELGRSILCASSSSSSPNHLPAAWKSS